MIKRIVILLLFLVPFNVKATEDNVFNSSGQCTILMDMDSKRILYADDIHTVRSIASITKIMTSILAIESGKINDTIKIGSEIRDAYGSGIYIKENEEMKLLDLVYGLMLRSGNDAALSIAKNVSGSVEDFVKLMNQKAIELGMKNTTFNNPSGLDTPKSNYSTAYDMALLTSYAMKNELYRKVTSTKKYTLKTNMNTYIWHNKNKLLNSYKYATGGKTGFTEIAKRTLVTTASKNNINLVVVTLNDGNDFLDHKKLYEETFDTFNNYQILKEGKIDIVDDNYYDNYEFYIKDNFSYLLNNNETNSIILNFKLEQKETVENNDVVGKVVVKLGDTNIYETEIYVNKIEKKQNFFSKLKKWFKNLW